MASAVSKDFKTSLPNHLSPCCVCGLLSGAGKMLLKLLVGPIINYREANVGYCGGNVVRGIRTVGERRKVSHDQIYHKAAKFVRHAMG
jgi:hypothetical protein